MLFQNSRINQVADKICELWNENKDLPVYKGIDVFKMIRKRYYQSWGMHHGYSEKLFNEIVGRRASSRKKLKAEIVAAKPTPSPSPAKKQPTAIQYALHF